MNLIRDINIRTKILFLLVFVLVGIVIFSMWADSPGKVKFYLNRDRNDVYNETNTFQTNHEMYYRFVQTLKTEVYQITVIDKTSNHVYDTQTINVPAGLIKETSLSGTYTSPDASGTYIFKIQDTKNDILVAEGEFNVK